MITKNLLKNSYSLFQPRKFDYVWMRFIPFLIGVASFFEEKTQKYFKAEISCKIREIKKAHGLNEGSKIKWTNVALSNLALYKSLVDYIAAEDRLRIRMLVAKGKSIISLESFDLSCEDWYYAMYYTMLNNVIDFSKTYQSEVHHHKLILDQKDTHMDELASKLAKYLTNRFKQKFKITEVTENLKTHNLINLQFYSLVLLLQNIAA
jgi:magnesium-transporting ATPase (P-type)